MKDIIKDFIIYFILCNIAAIVLVTVAALLEIMFL